MKEVHIINGPNLNLLGHREPSIYGNVTWDVYFAQLQELFPHLSLHYFQSNHEGDLIGYIQENRNGGLGFVINGGAYSHTSIAIADALAAVTVPVVEVLISNVFARESFRHHSYISAVAKGSIVGLGLMGYELAIQFLQSINK